MDIISLPLVSLVLLSFFLGSIPSGQIIASILGVDLKTKGSGNTGATNVARVMGKLPGIVTLAIDMSKGILALKIAEEYLRSHNTTLGFHSTEAVVAVIAVVALVGHCFSPFLNFSGGKGVATGGGIFLYLAPSQTLIALLVFALSFYLWRIVSISSILAAITVPTLLILGSSTGSSGVHPLISSAALLCALLIVLRHKANLRRLAAGKEPQFKFAKEPN